MDEIRVVSYGLGTIGKPIAKLIIKKQGMRIVGAIDISKELIGKDLGDILGINRMGVTISGDAFKVLGGVGGDVVVHATKSYLNEVYDQLVQCIKAGYNVVSTCEELAYPFIKYPELSAKIDNLAREEGVTVLATGVNPGFAMDTLPILLTSACQDIKKIKVSRVVDLAKRRRRLQEKWGLGRSPDEFYERIKEKIIIPHVGLSESIAMIASAIGWKLDYIQETPAEPLIADREYSTQYITIKPGTVMGLRQRGVGIKDGEEVIILELIARVGIEAYNEVVIDGVPSIHLKTNGAIGDATTIAMVVNMIPKVIIAPPGLLTMKDITLPSAVLGDARLFL